MGKFIELNVATIKNGNQVIEQHLYNLSNIQEVHKNDRGSAKLIFKSGGSCVPIETYENIKKLLVR